MTYPEEWSFNSGGTLTANAEANRGIAQRNIKIAAKGATGNNRIVNHQFNLPWRQLWAD